MPNKKIKKTKPKADKPANGTDKKPVTGKSAKAPKPVKRKAAKKRAGKAKLPHKSYTLKKERFLSEVAKGRNRSTAAKNAGIHRTTAYAWMADPDYLEQVEALECEAIDRIEDRLYEAALAGEVVPMIFLLKNRRPQSWKDRRNDEQPSPPDRTAADENAAFERLNQYAMEAIEREQRAQLAAEYPEAVRQAIERGDMVGRAASEELQRLDDQAGVRKVSGLHLVRGDDDGKGQM